MGQIERDSHWHEEVDHPWAGLERRARTWLYRILGALIRQRARARSIDFDRIKRVLIIKEPYRMGDLLQITPLLRALKSQYPSLFIGLVIQDRNLPVFLHNPHLARIHSYEKKNINRKPWRAVSFIKKVRRNGYDLAVTLETERCHMTNDLIAYFSGAPLRLRYDGSQWNGKETNAFYNVLVPFDSGAVHQIEKNFNVLLPFGVRLKDRSLELRLDPHALDAAKSLLARLGIEPGSRFVVVHPGAYKLRNRWPLENFMAIAERLNAKSRKTVFTLGPSESSWEEEIKRGGMPVVSGQPLPVVSAVLGLSELVLCNDTGIMHVAGGLGVKTLALFAETDPAQWKPPGDNVRFLRAKDFTMETIGVEDVWNALMQQIKPAGSPDLKSSV